MLNFFNKKKIVRNVFSCHKDWDNLSGDDFRRHCDKCDSWVYNLVGLTNDEIWDFIEKSDGTVCALSHVDRNGFVVNGACSKEFRRTLGRHIVFKKSETDGIRTKIKLSERRTNALRRLLELYQQKR